MFALNNYKAICEAIALLFPEQIEVVVHDLKTGKIAHIQGAFSNRETGEGSLIDAAELASEEGEVGENTVLGPYSKFTPQGEKIKSITAVIRDEQSVPIKLLCINMKTGALESYSELIGGLIGQVQANTADALMSKDWRENSNEIIANSLQQLGKAMHSTDRADKLVIVRALNKGEIFQIRGSSSYIAKSLGCSRASLYSLLRDARQR